MLNYNKKLFSYKDMFEQLVDLDTKKKLPPRLLLSGQKGIGKRTFSFHLINYLFSKNEKVKYNLDENTISSDSKSYLIVNNLSHPNFYYLSNDVNKKNIEINQVRNMITFLNKSTFDNNKKIILIDGAENLNTNSANALLKSLEDSNQQNLFILTHNTNTNILDTIKSRCVSYKLNFDFSQIQNIIFEYFGTNLYEDLNYDFKNNDLSPYFLINHIIFIQENKLDIKSIDIKSTIHYIIDNKSYKKNEFISENFQSYIEIYFTKMYLKTKDYKYFDVFLKIVTENNLINKYNLDTDSFFIKFENKYLNI